METYVVKRLAQAKLLTDPFKLKLLEQFSERPSTTKQVADRLGEKAPRLYRHVDALFDEGLLELVEEKPKRGTVERYYRTIAERFEMDPNLFSAESPERNSATDMVRSLFRDAESDVVSLIGQNHGDDETPDDPALVVRVAIRASADEIARLRDKLNEWVSECNTINDNLDDRTNLEPYSGLLAFYPRPDNE